VHIAGLLSLVAYRVEGKEQTHTLMFSLAFANYANLSSNSFG